MIGRLRDVEPVELAVYLPREPIPPTKPGWRSEIFDDAPHDHDAVAALQVHHDPRICGQRFASGRDPQAAG